MERSDQLEVHESDEELRFFSRPPEPDSTPALSDPASLSPTTSSIDEETPADPEKEAEFARYEARRAKLRQRVVATLTAAAALLVCGVAVRSRIEAERRRQETAQLAPTLRRPVTSPPPTTRPAAAKPPPSAVAEPAASASAPVTPVAATVPKLEPQVAPPDNASLLRKARELLHSGHSREGVAVARDAVSQTPSEAEPYVLLGAGLQDLGDFKQARTVFADCVRNATHGPASTCRYFASR